MATQSSTTVFVKVAGDMKPTLTGTLEDADGQVVPRAGKTAKVAFQNITGGSEILRTAAWADSPTNTRPTLAWTSANDIPAGVYRFRFVTDDGGTDQWSFPTEQMHTAIIVARGSSAS